MNNFQVNFELLNANKTKTRKKNEKILNELKEYI